MPHFFVLFFSLREQEQQEYVLFCCCYPVEMLEYASVLNDIFLCDKKIKMCQKKCRIFFKKTVYYKTHMNLPVTA